MTYMNYFKGLDKMLDELRDNILNELINYKKDNNLTKKDLQILLNTKSKSYIDLLLNKKANLNLETIIKIAGVINKKPSFVWLSS